MTLAPALSSILSSPLAPAVGEGVGVAQWWPSGSLWSLDAENSRFRDANGVLYTAEAAFNTANNITKSGEARTWPTQTFGSAISSDPNFDAGVDSWLATTAQIAVAQNASMLRATNATGTATQRISRAITTDPDQAYYFETTIEAQAGTGSAGPRAANGNTLGSAVGSVAGDPSMAALPATRGVVYGCPNATTYFGISFGSMSAGATCDLSYWQGWKCRPYTGFTKGSLSARVSFTTPATLAAIKVLTQWGDGSERNRVRLVIDASAVLRLIVTRDNTEVANLNLGTLVGTTRYSVKFAVTANRASASLDGAAIVTDTSLTVPGLGYFWLGRSVTGETFDGTIHAIDVWAEALSDAALVSPFKAMVVWGDSLATTTGASVAANAWWNLLAADLGWTVVSKGVGGNDTATELSRFNSETEVAYDGWLNIFIDRPNTGEASVDWLTNVAAMAAQVSRWFVVPPLLNSASGLPDTSATAINAVKEALLAGSWVGHSLDSSAQAALQATMDSDSTRAGTGDWTHFNDTGHAAVKASVKTGLQAVGLA